MADAICGIENLTLARKRQLRQTRDTGTHAEGDGELLRVQLDKGWILGPRPDKAHLAFEDVDELRDLVELRPRQDASDAREPGVVRSREHRAPGSVVHLAELQHGELDTMTACSPAAIQHGPPAVELDRKSDDNDERHQHDEQDRRQHEIERALSCRSAQEVGLLPTHGYDSFS